MSVLEKIISSEQSGIYTLVLFYMPDCASCVETRPFVVELSKRNSIDLFQVSSEDSDWIDSARHFGITDFPTLVVISRLAGQKMYLGAEKIQTFTKGAQAHFDLVNSK